MERDDGTEHGRGCERLSCAGRAGEDADGLAGCRAELLELVLTRLRAVAITDLADHRPVDAAATVANEPGNRVGHGLFIRALLALGDPELLVLVAAGPQPLRPDSQAHGPLG